VPTELATTAEFRSHAGVELIDVVGGRESFYRSERFCVHRDGIELGSSA